MSKGIMTNGITTSEENYYFSKGYQQGRADVIEEYKSKCIEEIEKLVDFYNKDKKNRPKPNITSAVVILELMAERLKEQTNE